MMEDRDFMYITAICGVGKNSHSTSKGQYQNMIHAQSTLLASVSCGNRVLQLHSPYQRSRSRKSSLYVKVKSIYKILGGRYCRPMPCSAGPGYRPLLWAH